MRTSTKILILLIIFISLLVWSLYKGYKIIPIVDIEQTTSYKGNPLTNIQIELTNPFREQEQIQEMFDKKKIETEKQEEIEKRKQLLQEGKENFESKHPEYKNESN